MKKTFKTISTISLSLFLLSGSIMADDISDTIEDALSAYKKGDISGAKEDLTYVLELLKQKKGDDMKAYLPDALDGWKAEEATSETAGSGMLGGGTTLSRTYTKDKSKVVIEIVTDSPLLSGLGSMFSNPMFSSGGKLKRINREKAMINYDKKREAGDISLMIDKRFMVTVKGSHVSEDELIEYTRAIDFKALKKM